ncbi:hypothetical protein AVEN_171135-1 [Araneus ventricosus]|uniref:Uncharacterized protein n=1 Tax=Araneus ventricosus TaxID=182803 RepID=A0A4Y2F2T4_ARAVE|nr:hypothetical protein AVEN_171135-1 [Araneus ventricosus]
MTMPLQSPDKQVRSDLFWYPRLGSETSLFPHVKKRKDEIYQPIRRYQNRPDIESRISDPPIPNTCSITMPSQSPDKQGRYRLSNQRSSDSNDTTLSPCNHSHQTIRYHRAYSGTPGWVGRRHSFRTLKKGKWNLSTQPGVPE